MGARQRPCNRQPKPDAAGRTVTCGVQPDQPLEYALAVRLVDAGTVVVDAHERL